MRKSPGFSLIELVIAVSLASFVLVGVATIAAQMTRAQVEGIRSGTVTGWSLVSYLSMSKEVEDSNVLAYPIADGSSSDALIVCRNWSRMMGPLPGGKLDAAGVVSVVQYCVDTSDPVNFRLRRYANVGSAVTCPNPAAPVACSASPSGTWTETGVIGFRLEKLAGFPNMFTRDNSIGGVRLRYAIGQQAGTPQQPVPQFTPFNIGIAMQKQYNSAND